MSLTLGTVTRLCASKPWHLETRTAQTRGVGNQGDQRPVGVFSRHAENERGAYLRSEAQVDEPDLATFGRAHRGFSA